MIYPINPNDNFAYVWDGNNDCYVRVLNPGDHLKEDYEDCDVQPVGGVTLHELMERYNLVLNVHDKRTWDELNTVGQAYLYRDKLGKVIGAYHDSGPVASIPEWKFVDWDKVNGY